MSRDATVELFKAVRLALLADATISAAVATRIATDWGVVLTSPYIRLSVPTVRRFEDDCGDGSEYTLRVHVFANDRIVTGNLAAQVREVLQDREDMALSGADVWWFDYDQTINQQDPDDPTLTMAVVVFKAVTTS
jgi:hypothetical protein